jgi:epoxyqueuosine reductase
VERCINYHKERSGDLPDWIEPSWHDCLVGCLQCQKVCPQNVRFKNRIEKEVEFSNNETKLILKGVPIEQLPEDTVKMLEKLDIIDYLEFISRDLSIFVERMH